MYARSRASGPRSLQPDLLGAGALWMFSACGVAVSVLLTLLKFRSAYGCDVSLLSACQIGGIFSCDRVLQSDWATFFGGVPISVLATAHYAILLGIATCMLTWPARFIPAVRPLMLWIACAGLAIVPPLFSYSLLAAKGLCSYCVVVYLLNTTIFLVAWWMHPEGIRPGLWAWFQGASGRGRVTSMMTGLSFVALILVQMVVYREESRTMETKARCLRHGELPPTSLITDATEPEVEIALFIDLACPACKEEFNKWSKYTEASEGRFRLAIYHFPREGECQLPDETGFNPGSRYHKSCLAARAVECAESRRAGAGRELVNRLFALQEETAGAYFTRERLLALARELAIPGAEDESFMHCAEHDPDVLAKILTDVQFATAEGLTETPGAFFTFHEHGKPLPRLYLVKGSKSYKDVNEFLKKARAEVQRSLLLE